MPSALHLQSLNPRRGLVQPPRKPEDRVVTPAALPWVFTGRKGAAVALHFHGTRPLPPVAPLLPGTSPPPRPADRLRRSWGLRGKPLPGRCLPRPSPGPPRSLSSAGSERRPAAGAGSPAANGPPRPPPRAHRAPAAGRGGGGRGRGRRATQPSAPPLPFRLRGGAARGSGEPRSLPPGRRGCCPVAAPPPAVTYA